MINNNHFGVMIDCSRNAVMSVSALKRWIDLLEKMGYNTLMLYTEDTYEVQGEPYFGYLRGRYNIEEIREIDTYCNTKGIELIPCIQTLAHLNELVKWPAYTDLFDVNDILMADDERTYNLIEKMFKSLAQAFSSRLIHIGMDEAAMIGLGKYLCKHGFTDRFEILKRHLKRVSTIAEKYGFSPIMWSDMFFRLACGGEYYTDNPDTVNQEIAEMVPENISLVYWDYYSLDRNHYENMIEAHKHFDKPVWFAGGLWTWMGLVPHNAFSVESTRVAVESCLKCGIKNIFFTLWGDDGAEASIFSVLPSLFYSSQIYKGISDIKTIKSNFKELIGIGYDDFMLLDLPGINHSDYVSNAHKYMLFNDYFLGMYDPLTTADKNQIYADLSERLKTMCSNKDYGYLFQTEKSLCDILKYKNDIGLRTRNAYQIKDKESLRLISEEYKLIIDKIKEFLKTFRTAWFKDKKPFGFEVQEVRIGGLIARTYSCCERLEDYIDGRIDKIEELEEVLLDPTCGNLTPNKDYCYNSWKKYFTNTI